MNGTNWTFSESVSQSFKENDVDYITFCKVKMLCPICCTEHEVERRSREGGAIIRGRQVRYYEEYFVCTLSEEDENEFETGEMFDQNVWRARLAYDREYGRLSKNKTN